MALVGRWLIHIILWVGGGGGGTGGGYDLIVFLVFWFFLLVLLPFVLSCPVLFFK